MVTVNNASELTTQLNAATGGETIELAAGVNFGRFSVPGGRTYTTPVMVRSLDPLNPATFEVLEVYSSNLTFKDFTLDYIYRSGDFAHTAALYVDGNDNITCDNLRLIGNQTNGGVATGRGADFRGSTLSHNTNITFRNSYFEGFPLGLLIQTGSNVLCDTLEFNSMAGDCINPAGVKGITLRNIYGHDWSAPDPNAHVDFIQLLRPTFTGGCTDVLMEYCVCDQGAGLPQQGQWAGGDNKDLSNDFYRHKRVTIINCLLIIGHSNGIAFAGTDDYTVQKTTLLSGPFSLRDTVTGGVPLMDFNDVTNVTFEDTIHMGFVRTPPSGSVVNNNYQVTRADIGGPNIPTPNVGDVDGFNDYQIASGAFENAGRMAGSRTGNRIGGWGGEGVAPHAAYQALPAGYQSSPVSPTARPLLMSNNPILLGGSVIRMG